jgi:hypothetical protein
VGPFGDKEFLCVLKSAEGFGLGIPIDGVEDPIFHLFFSMMRFFRAGLLAAWQRRRARLRVMVTLAIAMEAVKAGVKGASLDGSDQLSESSVARVSA